VAEQVGLVDPGVVHNGDGVGHVGFDVEGPSVVEGVTPRCWNLVTV
jgi:hypothetical protein